MAESKDICWRINEIPTVNIFPMDKEGKMEKLFSKKQVNIYLPTSSDMKYYSMIKIKPSVTVKILPTESSAEYKIIGVTYKSLLYSIYKFYNIDYPNIGEHLAKSMLVFFDRIDFEIILDSIDIGDNIFKKLSKPKKTKNFVLFLKNSQYHPSHAPRLKIS